MRGKSGVSRIHGTVEQHRYFAPVGPFEAGFEHREALREKRGQLTYREYCSIFSECRQVAIAERIRDRSRARDLIKCGRDRGGMDLGVEEQRVLWRYENRKRFSQPIRAILPRGIKNPEAEYRRNKWRLQENPDVHAAARARRRLLEPSRQGDTAGYYRTIRSKPVVSCTYCRKRISGAGAHIDHKVPLARGGRHERANLTVACATCNMKKNTKTDVEFRALLEARTRPRDTQSVHETKTAHIPVYAAQIPDEVSL